MLATEYKTGWIHSILSHPSVRFVALATIIAHLTFISCGASDDTSQYASIMQSKTWHELSILGGGEPIIFRPCGGINASIQSNPDKKQVMLIDESGTKTFTYDNVNALSPTRFNLTSINGAVNTILLKVESDSNVVWTLPTGQRYNTTQFPNRYSRVIERCPPKETIINTDQVESSVTHRGFSVVDTVHFDLDGDRLNDIIQIYRDTTTNKMHFALLRGRRNGYTVWQSAASLLKDYAIDDCVIYEQPYVEVARDSITITEQYCSGWFFHHSTLKIYRSETNTFFVDKLTITSTDRRSPNKTITPLVATKHDFGLLPIDQFDFSLAFKKNESGVHNYKY